MSPVEFIKLYRETQAAGGDWNNLTKNYKETTGCRDSDATVLAHCKYRLTSIKKGVLLSKKVPKETLDELFPKLRRKNNEITQAVGYLEELIKDSNQSKE
jgi:hypothetical protein